MNFRKRIIYAIFLFFVAAASFNGFFSKMGFMDGDSRRSFEKIINGTADRPYIYRQLLPSFANCADRLVPQSLQRLLASARSSDGRSFYVVLFQSPVALNPVYSFRYLVMYLEAFAAAVLAVFILYIFCRSEGYQPQVALISSSLLILLIPYIQIRGGGFYCDYPEVAFLGLAVLVARRFHWLWLIPIAALGTFNKESFILIILTLWPLLNLRWKWLYASLQVCLLEIVGASIYFVQRWRFHGNPGGTVEVQLHEQFVYFTHPVGLIFKLGKVYGAFLPEMMTVFPIAILAYVIWRGWKGISFAMRQQGKVAACIVLPLFIVLSTPGEVRDLCMLDIVLLLAIASNLAEADPMQSNSPIKFPDNKKLIQSA